MTTGRPADLVRGIDEQAVAIEALAARYGRRVAVSPRYALSVDAESLARLGALAASRGLPVQTHLAETEDEVATAARRFPGASGFAGALRDAGLLGPRTLLGHVVHASDEELRHVAEARAVVVHCPTSNRDLGSGTMPLDRIRRAGIPWVLGSDVGAGPELCMLDAMDGALAAHPPGALGAVEAWHRATLGPTAVLGGRTEDAVSCGMRAGALVIDPPDGVPRGETDPAPWLEALLAKWRNSKSPGFRRAVAW
ncbi:MAG: 5'-deoxyadenosine deaminase [Planctomycetes bacterium]|nr:5'-deoxyadenosine deaminase [Planctomycetota bacterium]